MQKEGQVRIPSGCAISGIINKKGKRFSGADIIKSIALMHERSNGLGGGFAAYGIYPKYKEHFALHIFFDCREARAKAEEYINIYFDVETAGIIPTDKTSNIKKSPCIWRYFAVPSHIKLEEARMAEPELTHEEYVTRHVIHMNSEAFPGAYIFSSGKNMGAFKAVGYPEDVGEFYRLEDYKGYLWTAHGRFPTNTPGWWGGAHPFTLLDWSIVHNGEISSYDANRRYVEMFGYDCALQTDTEVITYLFDLLVRKHGLTLEAAADVIAAPMWKAIENMPEEKREYYTALRSVYSSALVNGPFSIILGFDGGLMALNDRLKLRSLIAAEKDDTLYLASEESAIRRIAPELDSLWPVEGGKPVIVRVEGE
ncbi:MAG: glutamine amidotransferase family protein [Oscillospiraceae bacterium]|nr:glutamine amidotransferase family protein [Oscillospiraceae bacterium]